MSQLNNVIQLTNPIYGSWLNGVNPPSSGIGVIGSYYIDTATGDYYTKTTSITWVLLGNLTGSAWLSGSKPPNSNTGGIGDFYIDTATGNYYTKENAITWVLLGNFGAYASINPSTGVDAYYVYDQVAPAAVWTIVHNLGKNPSVTTVDSAGQSVIGVTIYINTSVLEIHFSSAMAGQAFLN
jgi:hypothetical protein